MVPTATPSCSEENDISKRTIEELYQSILTIKSEDVSENFQINDFTIETDLNGNYSTTNGEIILYPNLGNYDWDFYSDEFNRTNNLINIVNQSQYENIEPYRIILTFKSQLNMNEINLKLSAEEINIIIEALSKQPFIQVYKLIEKIHLQAKQNYLDNGQNDK